MLRLLLLACLVITAAAAELALDPPPPGEPKTTPLPTGKPWIPGWCRWDWRAGWVGQHDGFVATTTKDAAKITAIFYGDSITQGWGSEAKELFAERYGKRGAVNYGIGGDSTRQLLWRISHVRWCPRPLLVSLCPLE